MKRAVDDRGLSPRCLLGAAFLLVECWRFRRSLV